MGAPKDPEKYITWIEKIRIAKRGKPNPKTSETRKKLFKEGKLKLSLTIFKKGNDNNKGKKFSEEHRKNISIARSGIPAWNKGKRQSEEQKKNNSMIMKRLYREGRLIPHMKGKKFSEEHRRKISETRKEMYSNGMLVTWNKGKKGVYSNDTLEKISKTMKGRHYSPKTEFTSERIKEMWKNPSNRKKFGEKQLDENKILELYVKEKKNIPFIAKEFNVSVKTIMKKLDKHIKRRTRSERSKITWQDPKYKEKTIKAQIKASHTKPNKKEQFIDSILQSNFPNEWKLNINGETILNGKVPDWINCNGQKKVILFNGNYWHLIRHKDPLLTKEIVEEKERKPYNELGFKVLFIWEDEIIHNKKLKENWEETILKKVKGFENGDQ